jgi:putative transposase
MSQKYQHKYRIESIRLKGYDYRNEGAYFITICTNHREHYFGECINSEMLLNTIGLNAQSCWAEIPNHFPNTSIGEFVVMPNHVHGIIIINEKMIVERGGLINPPIPPIVETHNYASLPPTAPPTAQLGEQPSNHILPNEYYQNLAAPAKSISKMMRAYKSVVTVKSKQHNMQFKWQSRFYDHIIRSQSEFDRIAGYIANNPFNWKEDRFYIQ